MGTSHYEVAVHFAKRESKRDKRGSNVFTDYENTRIYSYGRHFCMAYVDDERKIVVVNGDRYGVTTSRHQSEVRGALQSYLPSEYQQITVPFSVLRSAGVDVETVTPLDVETDYEDAYCKTHNMAFVGDDMTTAYSALHEHIRDNDYQCKDTHYEHRLGGSVFRAKTTRSYSHRSRWEYFLSGFDETHNSRTDGYFISQLPHAVKTVAEGYESLKPKEVRDAIAAGLEVKRQGDAFAIPVPNLNVRKMVRQKATLEPVYARKFVATETGEITDYAPRVFLGYDENNKWLGYGDYIPGEYKAIEVSKRLDVPTFGIVKGVRNSHGANDIAVNRYGHIFARGNLIHRPFDRLPDHKNIKLGKIWHRIVFNTAKASWQSQTGRVD